MIIIYTYVTNIQCANIFSRVDYTNKKYYIPIFLIKK